VTLEDYFDLLRAIGATLKNTLDERGESVQVEFDLGRWRRQVVSEGSVTAGRWPSTARAFEPRSVPPLVGA
jgi:hypothetical protein